MRVVLLFGILSGRIKVDAPEGWRWRQKFHSDTNSLRSALTGEHNAALLFLLRFRIHQHQYFVVINLMPQYQQAAMRIHHQGFAHLAKLLPRMVAAQGLQLHPVKNALAAPVCGKSGFLHSVPIIGLAGGSVNCPFGQVFPIAMLFRRELVSPNPLAVECPKRLRHHAGRLLDQTAAALFFIILGKFQIRTDSLSLRLGAS